MDYLEIYDRMEFNKEYTAKELGVAAASMTAMVRRGLVQKVGNYSPNRYIKTQNTLKAILDILKDYPDVEYFTLYKSTQKLGMICSVSNSTVKDCWGNNYDLSNVNMMVVKGNVCPL